MSRSKYSKLKTIIISGLVYFLVAGTIVISLDTEAQVKDQPLLKMKAKGLPTNHVDLMKGPFKTGSDVTKACLECHESSADEIMKSNHWTWEKKSKVDWSDTLVVTGKKHSMNNFCISIDGNYASCTKCHVGYGWEDKTFNFNKKENIDCLVCHDGSGQYAKGKAGQPVKGVNLLAVAKSVSSPTRKNCGSCHFKGGGGNAVKHGDLDESLYHPTRDIDVHMGGSKDMQCTDCHQTSHHNIPGRAMSVSPTTQNALNCTQCHSPTPHSKDRLNSHSKKIACQTCHIPEVAKMEPTKTTWDWSTAGQDLEEDHHKYMKIKGSFTYEQRLKPEYAWYNGNAKIYQIGEKINPDEITLMNEPLGSRKDSTAKIWPFKVHRGKQIYDKNYLHLLKPKTAGEGGYWKDFDWDQALRLGSKFSGIPYSGEYDFAPTQMYWPLSHMVSPKEKSLQCIQCHQGDEPGLLNWQDLGYNSDPMYEQEGN